MLIRACLLAGMIPLLRGGDLPGIYAWLGMAFWPMLLFLWWNREYLHSGAESAPEETNRRRRHQKKRGLQAEAQTAPFSVTAPAKSEILEADTPASDFGAARN